jgi:hypothetical protein
MRYGQCLVEDQTGKVGIDFEGAKIEAPQTVNEPTAAPSGTAAMIGGVLNAMAGRNERYQRKEFILAPDIPIYVLGEVQEGGLVGKPGKGSKNKIFVISHKSEEERTKSLSSTSRWLLVIAIILLVLAAGLAIGGVWAKRNEAKAAAIALTQRA